MASTSYDSSSAILSFEPPVSPNNDYGTLEDTAQYAIWRMTSESMKPNAASTRSEEIDAERMTTGILRTDSGAAGTINSELAFNTFDEQIQYALQAAALPAGTHSAGAGVTVGASNLLTDVDLTAGNGYTEGRWIKISAATDVENNGVFRIVGDGAGSITVAGRPLTSGGSCTVDLTNFIENGITCTHFGLLKLLSGTPDVYTGFGGSVINALTIAGERGGLITASFDLFSKLMTNEGASHPSAGGNATASANPPLSSVADFNNVVEANALTATDIISFAFTLTNNLRPRNVMGTEGAIGVGNGSVTLEGSYTKYFENMTLVDKFLANTTSQFGVGMQDENGAVLAFDAPAIKYTDAQKVAGGKDTDILMELSFEGFKETASGNDLKMFSFHTLI